MYVQSSHWTEASHHKDGRCGKGVLGRKSKWLGCNVAVKQLNVDFDIRECNYIYNQWEFLIRFRHPHKVQLVGVIFPTNGDGRWSCNIVMELMDGDLLDLIDKRLDEKEGRGVPLTQRESIDIIKQIAKGIQHLHMKGLYAWGYQI